jgi:hypothetical protein
MGDDYWIFGTEKLEFGLPFGKCKNRCKFCSNCVGTGAVKKVGAGDNKEEEHDRN